MSAVVIGIILLLVVVAAVAYYFLVHKKDDDDDDKKLKPKVFVGSSENARNAVALHNQLFITDPRPTSCAQYNDIVWKFGSQALSKLETNTELSEYYTSITNQEFKPSADALIHSDQTKLEDEFKNTILNTKSNIEKFLPEWLPYVGEDPKNSGKILLFGPNNDLHKQLQCTCDKMPNHVCRLYAYPKDATKDYHQQQINSLYSMLPTDKLFSLGESHPVDCEEFERARVRSILPASFLLSDTYTQENAEPNRNDYETDESFFNAWALWVSIPQFAVVVEGEQYPLSQRYNGELDVFKDDQVVAQLTGGGVPGGYDGENNPATKGDVRYENFWDLSSRCD